MRFFKRNSYEIVRLFLNQIALAVFGIVLVFATRMKNGGAFGTFSLVASIFSVLFYLYILYATLDEMGMKHKVKIEGDRMARDRFYGMKIMLIAQIPNFVFLLLLFIGWFFMFVVGGGATTFGTNLYYVAQVVLYFLQSMYDGIIGAIMPGIETDPSMGNCLALFFAYLISTFPAILVSFGSYILGLHDRKLFFGHPPTSTFDKR